MKPKELSNPFSTGGGGVNFETRIQTSFAIIMLTDGVSPCLPHWPIEKIQLQGRHRGYQTDDIIVYVKDPESNKNARLLCQVKHDIAFTKSNSELAETLNAAWADFNNSSVFTRGIDSFALITGPLSGTNLQLRKVLELARNSTDGADFISKIKLGKFTSAKQKEKTGVFQELLRLANNGKTVSEEEFWAFLKAFNLLNYDLDIEQGVNIALINSLISQYDVETIRSVWAQLLEKIQIINQNAGEVIPENLPESIVDAFKRRKVETIPKEMARAAIIATAPRARVAPYSNELALAQLIGAWDDRNENDCQIVEAIVGESYDSWIIKLRDALFGSASPVHFKDGVWSISDRLDVWEELGDRVFDSHLKAFQQCAVAVLGEVDPKFDLPAEARYAASIHGKVMLHSNALRQGLADSLAILGCNPSALIHCAQDYARSLPGSVVHELLKGANWRIWGSLNRILPLLAEAAPVEFLNAIDNALRDAESPFEQLFEDEGAGFVGENYLTGLLWGLEALAWHPDYLSMSSLSLGGLHLRDPGGQWANRPLNSLVDIYLPWMPHTTSPLEIRKAAIKALKREQRPVAWQLLAKLLPRKTAATSGTYEPKWRAFVPQNWNKVVTNKEYVEQIEYYAGELLEIAAEDRDRGPELVSCLEFLPTPAFERAVEILRAQKTAGLTDEAKETVWDSLVTVVTRHRRYSHTEWSMSESAVDELERLADEFQPDAPEQRHLRLFTGRDFELYAESGDWEQQTRELEEKRKNAIREVYDRLGVEGVLRFARRSESPIKVGVAFGSGVDLANESAFIKKTLNTDESKIEDFLRGYLVSRFDSHGLDWLDALRIRNWSIPLKAELLILIGFFEPVWLKASELLRSKERIYWQNVRVNPYISADNMEHAIRRLIENGRPSGAVQCLFEMTQRGAAVDSDLLIEALSRLGATEEGESPDPMSAHYVAKLVEHLQECEDVPDKDKAMIEWKMLPVIENSREVVPKYLELKLATEADFYSEVIRLIFRSKKEPAPAKIKESDQRKATNAYRLLHNWRTPPGAISNTEFNDEIFRQWLKEMVRSCEESGHLDVALSQLGQVLIHAPEDAGGLWINKTVAEALNGKNFAKLRHGFVIGELNSRGAHWVDPTGKPEFELAERYLRRSAEVELEGYPRFAEALRNLADDYQRQGERIVHEYVPDNGHDDDG